MKREEVFRNACFNATLSYDMWERNPEEHNLRRLLAEAEEVVEVGVALLEKYGRKEEMQDAEDAPLLNASASRLGG
jgi:hypothetical protein